MSELNINRDFSQQPTVSDFINSTKTICILIAPLGEAKTFGVIAKTITHAKRCGRPIRGAIIRDTLENIKLSIVPSIQEFFEECPAAYRFHNEYKELTIYSDPPITVDLFGIDDPASLSKLQGSSAWSFIWLNEPAPLADKANAGLSRDVYRTAVVRALRHKATPGLVMVDMNPADEDHWTYEEFLETPDFDEDFPLITKQVWHVPYGENPHLKEESRQAAMKMYAPGTPEYIRYVQGKFAPIQKGIAVTPHYDRTRHMILAPNGKGWPLIPAGGLVGFASFDSWSNPACTLGQITQTNRLVFLDTLRLEDSDIETLMETMVVPMLESPRWKGVSRGWRICGDATMENMDQSSKNRTAARVVQKYFPGCRFEAGPREWNLIEPQLQYVFTHNDGRGEPLILLSGDNKLLDKGLAGAWHYRKNNSGERSSSIPVKDRASHFCDCLASAVCRLLPSRLEVIPQENMDQYRQADMRQRQKACGYATQGAKRR